MATDFQRFNLQTQAAAMCMVTALHEDTAASVCHSEEEEEDRAANTLALTELRKYVKEGCSPAQKKQLLQALDACSDLLLRTTTDSMTKPLAWEVSSLVDGVTALVATYREVA